MIAPTLDLHDFRERAQTISEQRDHAREEYKKYALEAADQENAYRKRLAAAFTAARVKGDAVVAAEIEAQAAAADAKRDRDIAQALAKAALIRIDELERNAATLRQEADWSQQIDRGRNA